MSQTVKLSSGKTTFEMPDGSTFEMDLVDLISKVDALRREKATGSDLLAAVVQLVNGPEGQGPLLTPGQADEFVDLATVAYMTAKKKRLESTLDMQK